MGQTALLSVQHLTFGYRQTQPEIRDLSFDAVRGDILGLLGPNGAGKTTLVSLIMGLLAPNSGGISINGRPAFLGNPDVVLVPQEYAFYPRLSARENLAYFAGILGLSGERAANAIQHAITRCDLGHCQHRRAAEYSGGQKRRLNFALALLTQPKLFILDEPTANVDPQTRQLLLENIRDLHHNGATIVYTSHLLGEVESLCNRVILLNQGQIALAGHLSELLAEEHRRLDLRLVSALPEALATRFAARPLPEGWWQCDLDQARLSPAELLAALEQAGIHPGQIRFGSRRLEDIYLATLSGLEHSNGEPV